MLRPPLPQYEPKLTDHNETIVHHILLYACGNASALPQGISDCYGADPAFSLCSKVIAGWAVGGPVSPPMRETGGEGGGCRPTEGREMGRGGGSGTRPVWLPNLPPSNRVTSSQTT